eukprot:scaffold92107_cov17-Prasinocladus_malaysianus.AAC.3
MWLQVSLEAVVDVGNFELAVSGRLAKARWPPDDSVAPAEANHSEYRGETQLILITGRVRCRGVLAC